MINSDFYNKYKTSHVTHAMNNDWTLEQSTTVRGI